MLQLTDVIAIIGSIVLIVNAFLAWRKSRSESEGVIAQASRATVESLLETLKETTAARDEYQENYEQSQREAWTLYKQICRNGLTPECTPHGREPDTAPLKEQMKRHEDD